jgi:hypothetical protein
MIEYNEKAGLPFELELDKLIGAEWVGRQHRNISACREKGRISTNVGLFE